MNRSSMFVALICIATSAVNSGPPWQEGDCVKQNTLTSSCAWYLNYTNTIVEQNCPACTQHLVQASPQNFYIHHCPGGTWSKNNAANLNTVNPHFDEAVSAGTGNLVTGIAPLECRAAGDCVVASCIWVDNLNGQASFQCRKVGGSESWYNQLTLGATCPEEY
jgi:hypothetical protein